MLGLYLFLMQMQMRMLMAATVNAAKVIRDFNESVHQSKLARHHQAALQRDADIAYANAVEATTIIDIKETSK